MSMEFEMSKIVARPKTKNEPDLLIGYEKWHLFFTDEDGEPFKVVTPPDLGWTHDLLEAEERKLPDDIHKQIWDVYLVNGAQRMWIGGSEI